MTMQRQNPTVLIVDDHGSNIKLIEGFLKQDGRYKYLSTTNPTEVAALCRQQPIDMVLLDIVMPQMDGFQVCQTLKQDPATREIPVIFLTANHETESIVKGFDVGGVDYLIKPVNHRELLARMTTQLNLRAQEQQLQALNATKDRFIAIIAEDLRGPITGLRGVLQMVDYNFDSLSQEHLHEYISMAHLAAESLDSLAANLTQWSSLHIRDVPLLPVPLDLHEVFASTIARVTEESPQKEIHFRLTITKGEFVTVDESSLRQVALNLLRNAVAFSHHHGEVTISAEKDGRLWHIAITDHGIGIDADNLQKLFKLDQRFSRVGTAGEMGSGMGLLLCQEILARNGGEIAIQSKLNKGTQVTFTLPGTTQ